ncbi:MAG TPA: hypothetical protein DCL49_04445 [Candidatus Omnitrophica bacterium]|nr:hypothetical protein [Candidatus Omnitrophota bacterium]
MRYIFIVIVLGLAIPCQAEENENFFGLSRVSFFKRKEMKKTEELTKKETTQQNITQNNTNSTQLPIQDDWTEQVIDSSGKITLHTPPAVVRDFVENPTEEKAEVYLEWNTKRVEKLFKAQEALARAIKKRETASKNAPVNPVAGLQKIPGIEEKHVVYFLLKGCSACKQQSEVVKQIHAEYPEVIIEAFGKGYTQEELRFLGFPAKPDMGISKLFGISTFPTMLVFNEKGDKYFVYGLKEKEEILKLLR